MTPGNPLRYAVLLLHAALIAGLWIWAGAGVGALLILPLLAPLPGLLRGRAYTAAWASMLVVFYVAGLLAEGVAAPSRRGTGTLLAVIAALDFVSLLLFARLQARQQRAAAAQTGSSDAAAR